MSAGDTRILAADSAGLAFGWGGAASPSKEAAPDSGAGAEPDSGAAQIPGLSDIYAVWAGDEGSLAVTNGGEAIYWENGEDGYKYIAGLTDIEDAIIYDGMIVALDQNGVVWSCALDAAEGNGPTPAEGNSRAPARVLKDVSAVSAAGGAVFFLKTDGSVWAYGSENPAAGPDGLKPEGSEAPDDMKPAKTKTPDSLKPEKIEAPDGVISISAGEGYLIALKDDGTVWMRSDNEYVRPACGQTEDDEGFALVLGIENVRGIAAGRTHCLAVKEDRSVWGWGDNRCGALGDSPDETVVAPVMIIPGRENAPNSNDFELKVTKGKLYYLPLEGKGLLSFEGVSIRTAYDSGALRLLDAAAHLPGKYTSAGPAGDGLSIQSCTDGEVVISLDKYIPLGKEWSGPITLMVFEALKDGETLVSVTWNN